MTPPLLLEFLKQLEQLDDLEITHYPWELLIRQARHANLVSRIGYQLKEKRILEKLPSKAQLHFKNAIKIGEANKRASLWEIKDTGNILKKNNIDFILLKGCAYLWLDIDASKGRLFADTDILVLKNELNSAERALVHNGWVTTKVDHYDQLYYRSWTHEIPPLHHTTRHTTLDVHHDIVPPIITTDFDISAFWSTAIQDDKYSRLYYLQPMDMILHSATHLFHEGEFDHALRDLVDLDSLLKQYIIKSNKWDELLIRAKQLDLHLYLYYALNFTNRILSTPVPDSVMNRALLNAGINPIKKYIMDGLFLRAFTPDHTSCRLRGTSFARLLLFVRSHWLKMPWYLLIPHLLRKSVLK